MEQGQAWGVTFLCDVNKGPELYCCITGGHEDATPEWLSYTSEDELQFNNGYDYAVTVDKGRIYFVDEEVAEVEDMDSCCDSSFLEYDLSTTKPDYIILDVEKSRIKVDAEGYKLDDAGKRVGDERVFDVNELNEEALSEYVTLNLWEAKANWVKSVLDTQFPRDKKLWLAFDTE